jgi:hypothetical protein
MQILIRTLSFLLGLCVLLAPIYLSLLVASIEPSRPFQFSKHLPFILIGVFLSAGYFSVAIFSTSIATSAPSIRWLITFLLIAPLLSAIYFLFATHSGVVSALCIAVIICTVWFMGGCVWSSSNLSFKRDALKRAP